MVFMALFDAPLPRQSVSPVISIFLPSTSSFHLPHSLYPSLIPCRMKCIGGAIHLLPPPLLSQTQEVSSLQTGRGP